VASYHLSVKTLSRSAGRSATGAAAYRAAERIHDERTGEVFDYRRKRGVEHREMILPTDAPDWARGREALWNAAERAETRKNATVGREFEVALPAELSAHQRRELAVRFAKDLVQRHGFAADVAIHKPHRHGDARNHHAHILCSTRRLGAEGFGAKTRELDDQKTGPAEVTRWRERWAELQNEYLKEHGHEARVDHRTLEAQGVDREPTRHKGPAVTAMERRGVQTQVGARLTLEQQQEIQARLERAAELGRLEREHTVLARSILDLSGDLAAAKRERDAQLSADRTPAKTKDNLTLEDRFGERVEGRAAQLQRQWSAEREHAEEVSLQERQEQGRELERKLEKDRTRHDDLSL
jgi:ATP-dependent exoDNAse (exonuclease V) alpha subunit